MTKDAVLELLRTDGSVSGQEIAARLGVSRTAVWKAVEQLRGEGYQIESASNRGYRLAEGGDVLTAAGIAKYLRHKELRVQVEPCVTSTNAMLKAMAEEGAPAGTALVACRQTAGRGRRGRSFYSPQDSGLYLSLLLRPKTDARHATALTALAAVAAAAAIESVSGREARIKWVNDVFVDGKKVCGILTEAGVDWESGTVQYAVVGVGINVRAPEGGFPAELEEIAGAVFDGESAPEARCRLAAAVLDALMDGCDAPEACYEEYRKRSLVIGRHVRVLLPEREPEEAFAVDIERDFALLVRTEDGSTRRLAAGEVSIRPD